MKMTKGIVGLIVLYVVLVIVGPIITIWSLNTLFSLGIAYTFWTWLAVIVLGTFINSNIGRKSS
jgi:hypothetical protein